MTTFTISKSDLPVAETPANSSVILNLKDDSYLVSGRKTIEGILIKQEQVNSIWNYEVSYDENLLVNPSVPLLSVDITAIVPKDTNSLLSEEKISIESARLDDHDTALSVMSGDLATLDTAVFDVTYYSKRNSYAWATANSGGSANAQTITTSPTTTTLVDGRTFYFVAGFANTSSMTLQVDATSPVTVFNSKTGLALITGEVFQYMRCEVLYSNGNFFLLNACPGITSWTPTITVLAPMTIAAGPSNVYCYYEKNGLKMTYWGSWTFTTGPSQSTTIYFTMPGSLTLNSIVQPSASFCGSGYCYQGSNDFSVSISQSSNTLMRILRYDGGNFAANAVTTIRIGGVVVLQN
jgi:hypothetical protein